MDISKEKERAKLINDCMEASENCRNLEKDIEISIIESTIRLT